MAVTCNSKIIRESSKLSDSAIVFDDGTLDELVKGNIHPKAPNTRSGGHGATTNKPTAKPISDIENRAIFYDDACPAGCIKFKGKCVKNDENYDENNLVDDCSSK